MLHRNKEEFREMIYRTVKQTGFTAQLLEKDYYLTMLLSRMNTLSDKLVFKGGTCLNKIYYSYYRLSEDLDFSMILPDYTVTRGERRKCIKPVKDRIVDFAKKFDMEVDKPEHAGRNESKQYVYLLLYDSVIRPQKMSVKLEIGLRYSPILEAVVKPVQHKFVHPFTGKPLFNGGNITCLQILEIVSEKLRATATRKDIAPRDFYDLDFLIRNGFDFSQPHLKDLFIRKLKEDSKDTDLNRYADNLSRSNEEIKNMKSRIQTELLDVLTLEEKQKFNIDIALNRINTEFSKLIK
jgi:predicted nucleotidyltransferase component of viral defense system